MTPVSNKDRVVVIGGGMIGLTIGWQLARRGRDVTVFDRREVGRETSWVAAGMLAPHTEVGFEDEAFLRAGVMSLERYPRFLKELSADAGQEIAIDPRGTLIVAFNRDDTERIRRLYDFRLGLGLPVEWLLGSEAREKEPLLSPKVSAAIWLPDDRHVNNRRMLSALRTAFDRRGGRLEENQAVERVRIDGNRVRAVVTTNAETAAAAVVLAAGCWSSQVAGIPDAFVPPVRPIKGQIVSLRLGAETDLKHVVRSPDVYLVPKDDGRLLVGASQEEMGFDKTPTAGEVMRMLERAWEAIPSIYDLAIESIDVGLRPGSRDHLPIVGATPIDGLYLATGHFRHGILLAPLTADIVCDLIVDNNRETQIAAFEPTRFAHR